MKIITPLLCALAFSTACQAMYRENVLPVDPKNEDMISRISPRNSQKSPDRPCLSYTTRERKPEVEVSVDAALLAAYATRNITCKDDQQIPR